MVKTMRLIDADEVMSILPEEEVAARMAVLFSPTIDPVKHGRWDLIDAREPMRYGCSVCHRMVWHYENYCPNCGAKMDEEGV